MTRRLSHRRIGWRLHRDPRGRQMLVVFKTDRRARIQPGDLDWARKLWIDDGRLPDSQPSASEAAGRGKGGS